MNSVFFKLRKIIKKTYFKINFQNTLLKIKLFEAHIYPMKHSFLYLLEKIIPEELTETINQSRYSHS